MGSIARAFRPLRNISPFAPIAIPGYLSGKAALQNSKYGTYAAEGYQKNELVYAAIEELATSAAEPRMRAKVRGEWTTQHPILTDLLDKPNPFMDRFELWATVILHLSLAGNAYGLIVRSASGRPVQIWLMRPDRVRIVPDAVNFISHYEFDIGGGNVTKLPVADVIHWKQRNPLDDFYGMPPLMAAAGRVDVDNYMRDFVKAFFERAGIPAGMLNVEGDMDADFKRELKQKFSNEFSGPNGWHGLLVIDQKRASFTPMTANLGPSGLVVPDLDKISVRRILMVFGVPGALVGADDAPTSYAALAMVQRFFWDNKLAPLYKELVGPLNLRLIPNFPGVSEVAFDLSDVRALQEDVDQVHARELRDYNGGGITQNQYLERTGRPTNPDGDFYLIPLNMIPMTPERLGKVAAEAGDVRANVPERGAAAAPVPAGANA